MVLLWQLARPRVGLTVALRLRLRGAKAVKSRAAKRTYLVDVVPILLNSNCVLGILQKTAILYCKLYYYKHFKYCEACQLSRSQAQMNFCHHKKNLVYSGIC